MEIPPIPFNSNIQIYFAALAQWRYRHVASGATVLRAKKDTVDRLV